MSSNLAAALGVLKQRVQALGALVALERDVLEREFHGLDLTQLVKLTDAPALAVGAVVPGDDGSRVEQFVVDGLDQGRRSALTQALILGESAASAEGSVREVVELAAGVAAQSLVRDAHGTVYRIEDRQAVVEPQLTEAWRRSHPTSAPPVAAAVAADGDGDGELRRGIAALRRLNQRSYAAVRALAQSAGTGDLREVAAMVEPQAMAAVLTQIAVDCEQAEHLLDSLEARWRPVAPAPVPAGLAEPLTAPGHF